MQPGLVAGSGVRKTKPPSPPFRASPSVLAAEIDSPRSGKPSPLKSPTASASGTDQSEALLMSPLQGKRESEVSGAPSVPSWALRSRTTPALLLVGSE